LLSPSSRLKLMGLVNVLVYITLVQHIHRSRMWAGIHSGLVGKMVRKYEHI
jgi:hypothetical protein